MVLWTYIHNGSVYGRFGILTIHTDLNMFQNIGKHVTIGIEIDLNVDIIVSIHAKISMGINIHVDINLNIHVDIHICMNTNIHTNINMNITNIDMDTSISIKIGMKKQT